jgi:hypothetical protein
MGLTLNRRNPADGSYADIARGSLCVPVDLPLDQILTEGQRRHLAASLARVENALTEITALAHSDARLVPSLLTRQEADLPAQFGEAIRDSVAEARSALAELVSQFDLTIPTASRFRAVQALVVSSLVVIEDTVSRNLRGYGAIHPGLPARLDPRLDRLHEQLLMIGRALPPRSTDGLEGGGV